MLHRHGLVPFHQDTSDKWYLNASLEMLIKKHII